MSDSRPSLGALLDPLEVLVNLVYLTKQDADDKAKVLMYMTTAEEALNKVGEFTRTAALNAALR
jgi:hypothetical protein